MEILKSDKKEQNLIEVITTLGSISFSSLENTNTIVKADAISILIKFFQTEGTSLKLQETISRTLKIFLSYRSISSSDLFSVSI